MKIRYAFFLAILTAICVPFLIAQNPTIGGTIVAGDRARIAVPDFRAKGAAQPLMATFNETVWNDLADAGILDMVPKTQYPLEVPQSPADLRPPVNGQKSGMWLTDWSGAPVNTNYLGLGYIDVNGTDMVLRGSLLNVGLADIRTASVFANNPYFGPLTEDGARKIAHEYAADILKQMGALSLAGTKIYFVSNRTGQTEIWSMDFDGQNQQQMTRHGSITKMPTVSPDGRLAAYVTMQNTRWELRVINTETRRQQAFVTPATSTITTPEFSPDGTKLWFSMVINDSPLQIVRTNVNGGGLERVSQARAIELSARVNPKTGTDVIFISDRNRHQQLYKMNLDGTGIEMLTPGDGDVSNPAWSPDGRQVTFSWNRGFEPGNFNIFVMNVAKRELVQLTHGNGTNENPYWAPDGVHIVYSNRRGNSTQIYTMLANGQRVKQLTSTGNNLQPVWAAKVN